MLRVTVDVNRRGVAQLAIINMSRPDETGMPEICEYEAYRCEDVQEGERITESGEYVTTVHHKRSDGAAELIRKVMDSVDRL
jgi:hypothetical protein